MTDEPLAALLTWVESGGFAATHEAGASAEAVARDLLAWLEDNGWTLVRQDDTVVGGLCEGRDRQAGLINRRTAPA